MREGAKKRLIGAVILVLLAVIFVPMLVEEEALRVPEPAIAIPEEPDFEREFSPTEVFLEPAEVPLADGVGLQLEADYEYADDAAPDLLPPPTEQPVVDAPAPPAGRSVPPPPVVAPVAKTPVAVAQRSTPPDGPGWVVQVASLASASGAAGEEKKLRGLGFSAFIEKADVAGRTWFRVRVGPEGDRRAANVLLSKLKQRGYPKAFVKQYP